MLAVAVAADKSPPAFAGYGYGYGYKPFSYSYGVQQPYQKTQVHHYQHGLGYGYGQPYGYGQHPLYGYPYRYGPYPGYGYGAPAYSHVKYSGYPANYGHNVAHSKVNPYKYTGYNHAYAYKPAQFGYSSTVVHPVVTYGKPPAALYGKPEEEAEVMADGEAASGDEMPAEDATE